MRRQIDSSLWIGNALLSWIGIHGDYYQQQYEVAVPKRTQSAMSFHDHESMISPICCNLGPETRTRTRSSTPTPVFFGQIV
jgi:hypothetical protein